MDQATARQDAGQVGSTDRRLTLAALAAFTLLGFFYFPGHTWLQQDSQIYVAILEHLRDPAVLANDPVAAHPHVTFTLYDEITLGLCRATGADLRTALQAQQIVLRWAGLVGVYLLVLRLGLSGWGATFAAMVFGLGAMVTGPQVLTLEYEPVPRGFAVPLLMLALGLTAQRRWRAAGFTAAAAFLYHPPTALLFWAASLLLVRDRNARALYAPMVAGVVVLLLAAHYQRGEPDAPAFFGVIDSGMERLQRWRAPYNWLSQWPTYWLWHYPLLALFCFAALRRIRAAPLPNGRGSETGFRSCVAARFRSATVRERSLVGAMVALGVAMMPLQYVLIEKVRWGLMSSYQPARGVLFTSALAVVLGVAAAGKAASFVERWAWLTPSFLLPAYRWESAPLALALSAAAAWAMRREKLLPVVAVAALLLIPTLGGARNYPDLHTPELSALAAWARSNTLPESVFFFAGVNKDLAPGIFRAEARRAIYVDWKSGGQVNLWREFGVEWQQRWEAAHPETFQPDDLPALATRGIDYVVLRPDAWPSGEAVYRNARYVVVRPTLLVAQNDGRIETRNPQRGDEHGGQSGNAK